MITSLSWVGIYAIVRNLMQLQPCPLGSLLFILFLSLTSFFSSLQQTWQQLGR